MRRALFRRTAVAAVSVASLTLLVGACGADKPAAQASGAPAGGGSDAPGKGQEPAAKALTAAELEKVALAEGDVATHMIAAGKPADNVPAGSVKVDKPQCAPLADAMVAAAPGKPGASVVRKAIEKPAKMKLDPGASAEEKARAGLGALTQPVTVQRLASYDGKGAQEAFAALDKAGKDCAGGFDGVQAGDKIKIAKVTPDTVTGGDEARGWTFDMKAQGPDESDVVMKLAVVRKGGALSTFYTFSLGGTVKKQPVPVIEAQIKKLG
ncbi:lipoprotein [Streptomyces spiroverticillatus]|uniref:Lipoprotein n=1 Tax=Streptomyces finlayi TaxID=67296 RepID=A0A919C753_9ACTN|nr:hypothetical protein [Streptomyces finlayi]GGZ88753.1 lipoprotein [Streptomyces spiroverticillatus]GHC79715.1 lipoprotein [Streptomyces finlayi]